MGEKLLLDPNDPFFEPIKISVKGVAGSCYCCGQQIHVQFPNMDDLPLAKIGTDRYYVLICDLCEEDIKTLNEYGINHVSYDVLWIIQEPLENALFTLEEKNGEYSASERNTLMVDLYKETEKKMSNKLSKYIETLSDEEDTHEPRIKKQSKKNS